MSKANKAEEAKARAESKQKAAAELKATAEEIKKAEPEVKEAVCVKALLKSTLEEIKAPCISLGISFPISNAKVEFNGEEYFDAKSASHGDILINIKSVEALAEEFAVAGKLFEASELFHLIHSRSKETKPAWLVAFEAPE